MGNQKRKKGFYYLRIGSDSLEDKRVRGYYFKKHAVEAFKEVSDELARYGQDIDATIHISASKAEIVEYPDFVLSRGPRGGIKVERVS